MNKLGIKSLPVLICLASDMMYWRKARVFPAHKRILNELREKISIRRTARSLMRWMKLMEGSGLIHRTKRHRFTVKNGWEFRSSLYGITQQGWNLLVRAGVYTWDQINNLKGEAKKYFRKPKKTRKVFRPSGQLTSVSDILGGLGFNTS